MFRKIETFEHRGEGAFQAYLRQALMNRIRNELRNSRWRRERSALDESVPDPGFSPLEAAVGTEAVERYEAALQRLRSEERELIIARLELGFSAAEIAEAFGKPSSAAAHMAVSRAVLRLAEVMGRG